MRLFINKCRADKRVKLSDTSHFVRIDADLIISDRPSTLPELKSETLEGYLNARIDVPFFLSLIQYILSNPQDDELVVLLEQLIEVSELPEGVSREWLKSTGKQYLTRLINIGIG